LQRQAAQAVVGAEFQDDDGRALGGEGLGDARASAGGGLAALAGIDHAIMQLLARQPLPQQLDPAGLARDAVSRRQAVAEHQDHRRGSGVAGGQE
jgi:hypothetical protein